MERVTKLMEHGAHLVPGDERRLTFGSLGVVAHVVDDGELSALAALLGKGAHPCSATLGGTAEEVAVEKSDGLAVLVNHLKHLHVGMISRDVLALLECETVDTLGCVEHTVDLHAVNIEVGLYLVVGDIEHLLLHLGRIVEAVVGLQTEVGTLKLLGILLDDSCLGIGLGRIVLDELAQEVVDILWILSHCALERVVGVGGVAHEFALLGTQLCKLCYDGECVVLGVGGISAVDACLKHLATQVAILQTGEDGLLCGIDDDDAIGRLAATALGVLFALGNVGIAESGELLLAVYPNHGVVGGSWQEVAPLLLQLGNARIDLLHAFHLVGRKQSARTYEALVDDFGKTLVFALELAVLVVVDVLDALEKALIE